MWSFLPTLKTICAPDLFTAPRSPRRLLPELNTVGWCKQTAVAVAAPQVLHILTAGGYFDFRMGPRFVPIFSLRPQNERTHTIDSDKEINTQWLRLYTYLFIFLFSICNVCMCVLWLRTIDEAKCISNEWRKRCPSHIWRKPMSLGNDLAMHSILSMSTAIFLWN